LIKLNLIVVKTVDCGAGTDFWKETVIQLWESPEELGKRDYMSAFKALSILNKVDKIKPMEKDVEVKFEYSNPNFHTAQLFVNAHQVAGDNLVFHLGVAQTDCKAKETCGVPVEAAPSSANACSTSLQICSSRKKSRCWVGSTIPSIK